MRLPWIAQRPKMRWRHAPQEGRPARRPPTRTASRARRGHRRPRLRPGRPRPATAVHDSKEGAEVTVTADATGSGQLFYDWKLTKVATIVAQSFDPTFTFTPLDDGSYSVSLKVIDASPKPTPSRTESLLVHNVRPVLVVADDQPVNEGSPLDLSGVGHAAAGAVHRRRQARHAYRHGRLGRRTPACNRLAVIEFNGSGASSAPTPTPTTA